MEALASMADAAPLPSIHTKFSPVVNIPKGLEALADVGRHTRLTGCQPS